MKLGHRSRVMPPSPCTACGTMLDRVRVVDDSKAILPNPGDLTVCLSCGHLMGFCEDLSLRELTADEQLAAAGDKRILQIQWARGRIIAK